MQVQVDLHKIVNDAANRFQLDKNFEVTSGARDALIEPALPHQKDVQREVSDGKFTISFLESCVLQVLDVARKFVLTEKPRIIDRREVELSMQHYCPYVFWC